MQAKDEAVARVKALRRRPVAPARPPTPTPPTRPPSPRFIEFETGAPPPWATTDEAAPDVDTEPDAEDPDPF